MSKETYTGLLYSFWWKINDFMAYLNRGHPPCFILLRQSSFSVASLTIVYIPVLGREDTHVMEQNVASQTDAALYHSLSVHIINLSLPFS
jgi:hypothetical protein